MITNTNSIKKRLAQRVLLISVFIIVVITVFETYVFFGNSLSQFDKVDTRIAGFFLPPLIEDVWLLDRDDILTHMELILSQPNVEMAQLKIERGETITVGEVRSREKKTYTYKLVYKHNNKTMQIGSLSVFAGLDPLYKQTKTQAITYLIGNSVIVSFVAFFVVLLTRRLITRHLVDISNNLASSYSESIEVLPLTLNRKKSNYNRGDELENVVDAINNMRTNLVASYEKSHKSEKRLSQIADNSEMWIWETDKEGLYTYCSDACESMFGYSAKDIVGKKYFYDFFHPDDREELKTKAFNAFCLKQPLKEFQNRNVNRTGETIWFSTSGVPIVGDKGELLGYRGADIDITEKKKLFEEHSRAAQLAALGTVAAGVAHEINNPIQGIMNYAVLLQKDPENSERVLDISQRIAKESERIAKITKDLLHYSKDSRDEMKAIDINEFIQSALSLITPKIHSSGIQVDTDLLPVLHKVVANPQSIQQVVINLLDNAYDALRGKDIAREDKVISVRTYTSDANGKQELCIEVRDNGIGMTEEVVAKARDAFFSTKPSTEGTGLGLSIVNEIVDKHKGRLEIESQQGEYTKITVSLPFEA